MSTIKKIQAGTITYDIEPANAAELDVTNKAPTLAWNTTSTIATVNGTDITVKMPANPDTKVTVDASLSSTSTNPVQNKVINSALAGKAGTAVATTTTAGLMSAADKTKLDGVATGATKVTTDTVSGWGYTKNAGTVTQVKVGTTAYDPSSGVVSLPAYPTNTNQTIKAGSITFGANDVVQITAGSNVTVTPDATNKKITISSTNTTYNAATQSAAGLMSAADKMKLDNFQSCGAVAYCTSSGATAAKTATMPGFTLYSGQRILFYLYTSNTATSGVTLNVNNTGAKTVYINSSTAPNAKNFDSGYYMAYYTGTAWRLFRISLKDMDTGSYGGTLSRSWGGWITFEHQFTTAPLVFTSLKNSQSDISNSENLIKSITATGFWCKLSQPSGSSTSNYNTIMWIAVAVSEPTPA